MRGGKYPYPSAGDSWQDQSARAFRNLSEEVQRLSGLITAHGLNIPSGAKFPTGNAPLLPEFYSRRFFLENVDDFPDTLSVSDVPDGPSVGYVARPFLLRRTPFHDKTRDGIKYVYSSNVQRTASKTTGTPPVETTEIQVITPKYLKNDEIIAARHIWNGGAAAYPLAQGSPTLIHTYWIDSNYDGRAFAKKAGA